MGRGLGIQVAELDGSSSIVVIAIHCVKMDKTGHAAGSYKLLYFFPSTIIKYSSSLSAHITLCPGSLGKMSSSKAICQVFSNVFQWVISGCLTSILCGTLSLSWNFSHQVLLPAENTCFSPELLHKSFPFWAGCSGICLSRHSPPWWAPAGLCRGKLTDWAHVGPTSVAARTMGDAHSHVSQLGWSDVRSKWQLLPSSHLFSPLLIFKGTLKKLSCGVRGHVWSPWRNNSGRVSWSLETAFLLFFRIAWRMPVKRCPTARITSQRHASTAELLPRLPIPHMLVTTLSLLLKK